MKKEEEVKKLRNEMNVVLGTLEEKKNSIEELREERDKYKQDLLRLEHELVRSLFDCLFHC